jgi:hypothetical protein
MGTQFFYRYTFTVKKKIHDGGHSLLFPFRFVSLGYGLHICPLRMMIINIYPHVGPHWWTQIQAIKRHSSIFEFTEANGWVPTRLVHNPIQSPFHVKRCTLRVTPDVRYVTRRCAWGGSTWTWQRQPIPGLGCHMAPCMATWAACGEVWKPRKLHLLIAMNGTYFSRS